VGDEKAAQKRSTPAGKVGDEGLQENQRALLARPGQTYVASPTAKLMSQRRKA
jgi:hypothetical protein